MIQELPDDTTPALAYHRFQETSARIRNYLPDEFDPERELSEAREERFLEIVLPVDHE